MDALEELRQMHVEAKSAFTQLERAATDERGGLWAKLKPELEAHEQIEEKFVYDPAVKEATARNPMISQFHQRHEREVDQAKQMMDRIGDTDTRGDQFMTMVRQLHQTLGQHIEWEETQFWPVLRDGWGMERIQEAGDDVHTAISRAKAGAGVSGMMGSIGDAIGHIGSDR